MKDLDLDQTFRQAEFSDVYCDGDEERLSDCMFTGYNTVTMDGSYFAVAIRCESNNTFDFTPT